VVGCLLLHEGVLEVNFCLLGQLVWVALHLAGLVCLVLLLAAQEAFILVSYWLHTLVILNAIRCSNSRRIDMSLHLRHPVGAVGVEIGELSQLLLDEVLKADLGLFILEILIIEHGQVLRKSQLQGCILLFAVSEFKIKELLILEEDSFLKVELLNLQFLIVTVFSHLHTLLLEAMLFLVEFGQLGVLKRFKFGFVRLFLQLHQLILDFQHVEPISC